jgi:MinD-like ATPase involved in chromosome partitioning or flagellar assembly
MTPEIALAASARDWPDRFHRHLLDHGGARVASRVLGVEQATATSYEVLFIDDVCSFLTPRLVATLRAAGVEVIGVFDPGDGSDAKRRLLECGISDVIESDAEAEEMLQLARAAIGHRSLAADSAPPPGQLGWTIGITGATPGVGATEVAIGLAASAAGDLAVALVDLDPFWPSVAPRLDLPLHPNVRTAIDFVLHQPDQLSRALHRLGRLTVVGGVADKGSAAPISHVEAEVLLETLAGMVDLVVVDLGPLDRAMRPLVPRFNTLAVVGSGDPVGVTRMLRALETAIEVASEGAMVLVANKVPGRPFHHAEVRTELVTAWPDVPVLTLPADARVIEAAWEGRTSSRGPFFKAIGRAAALVTESVAP